MVEPNQLPFLEFIGRSPRSGLVLPDLVTLVPLSHLQSPSFDAFFLTHLGGQNQ